MGLGLEEEEKRYKCVKIIFLVSVSFGVQINLATVRTHLLGCGTGRTGVGTPGIAAEGRWTTLWPCTTEGLRTRRELLGSAGRGF